jgi:hypothetical protein
VRHRKRAEEKKEESKMETKNMQELNQEEKNTQELNQDAMEKVSGGDSIEEAGKKLAGNIIKAALCPKSPDGNGKHKFVVCSYEEAGLSSGSWMAGLQAKKCIYCGRIIKENFMGH